ncbi:hypothetical protein [Rummeliibacillus pycnus]|uniref:hypothetical protein n=1 Tax=Rummeliibacillus pycnus TaxID=101070 RepID=UPI003D2CA67B
MGYIKARVDPEKLKNKKLDFNEKYPYWQELWTNYTKPYSEVQIQNWKEETQAIEELEQISFVSRNEGLVKIQRIMLEDDTRDYLKNKSHIDGELKWFSILFHDDEMREGIEVRNHGEEVFFNRITKDEAEPIVEMFEKLQLIVEYVPDDSD